MICSLFTFWKNFVKGINFAQKGNTSILKHFGPLIKSNTLVLKKSIYFVKLIFVIPTTNVYRYKIREHESCLSYFIDQSFLKTFIKLIQKLQKYEIKLNTSFDYEICGVMLSKKNQCLTVKCSTCSCIKATIKSNKIKIMKKKKKF